MLNNCKSLSLTFAGGLWHLQRRFGDGMSVPCAASAIYGFIILCRKREEKHNWKEAEAGTERSHRQRHFYGVHFLWRGRKEKKKKKKEARCNFLMLPQALSISLAQRRGGHRAARSHEFALSYFFSCPPPPQWQQAHCSPAIRLQCAQ